MARKAKKMAAKLIKIHTDQNERFILPQNEFKTISGRKKMTPKFLSTVDELLRRQGYALIDLHTEKGLFGVVSIEQVAHGVSQRCRMKFLKKMRRKRTIKFLTREASVAHATVLDYRV